MKQFFIIERKHPNATKLVQLEQNIKNAFQEQKRIAESLNVIKWRSKSSFYVAGGFSALIFKDNMPADSENWKRVNVKRGQKEHEFMPRTSTAIGRQRIEQFAAMPIVSNDELCETINLEGDIFKYPGVNFQHDEFIGVLMKSEWAHTMPEGFQELGFGKYCELFPSRKNMQVETEA